MAQFEHGFALLIGASVYKVPGWSLPLVAEDIAAVAQALVDPARCAYPPEHVKVIAGEDATRQGILDGLDWLHDRLQADQNGVAVILYSGHSWQEPAAAKAQPATYYLIPYDARQDNLRSRALRVEDFADAIQALPPCRWLVLLDTGHAPGSTSSLPGLQDAALPPGLLMGGERAIGAADGNPAWAALPQNQGRAVVSSAQTGQASYNRRDGKTGIFAAHLVEALSGKARTQAGATVLWLSDVISHLARCLPQSAQAEWGAVQQPDYLASGNFPLGLLLGGKGAPEAAGTSGQAVPGTVHTGGDFTGRDKTVHGDVISGDKFTGDQISGDKVAGDSIKVGNISGDGSAIAIGRNARVSMTTQVSHTELARAFAPIDQVVREAPPEKQAEAAQKVAELKQEAAKGQKANDSTMAKLLDELVGLVPGMVTAVASTFGTPLLGGIVGPVTAYVVDKIRGAK